MTTDETKRIRFWFWVLFVVGAAGFVLSGLNIVSWAPWLGLGLFTIAVIAAQLSIPAVLPMLDTQKALDVPSMRPSGSKSDILAQQADEPASSEHLEGLEALQGSGIARGPAYSSGRASSRKRGADEVESGATTLRVAKYLHQSEPPTSRADELDSSMYELVEKLGAGNMGEIWRGRHKRLGRPCAVKLLQSKAADWEDEQRFEREARVMATLASPHTVEIYDFGIRQDGSFFYVMELLDGIDLQKLISRFGPLPASRVVHILRQACHSLEEAHAAGLVHRDLKPANMILCRYGRDVDMLKLVDFGLAKEEEAPDGGKKLTRLKTVLGTAAYLAPESRSGSVNVDHRADLYALGCIAFWLLTGRLVFQEKNPIKMVQAHIAHPPPNVADFVPGIPEPLAELITQCLAKNPDERVQDARALKLKLDEISRQAFWTDEQARDWWRESGASIGERAVTR